MGIVKKLTEKGVGHQRKGLKPKLKTVEIDPNQVSVLMHCDYNCTTGFAKVAEQIINELVKDKNYKLIIHAINDFSKEVYQVNDQIMVKPAYLNEKNDHYGRLDVLNAVYQSDFDFVFLLNDVEIISVMMEHFLNIRRQKKKEKRPFSKLITYSPIDSPIRKCDVYGFEYINSIFTYTEYAKKQMEFVDPKLKGKIRILPHGVNTKDFYRLTDKEILEAKIDLVGKSKKGHFIFGTVNRNQVRKDLGTLLLGFRDFKICNPNVNAILYLHCNPEDVQGINLKRLTERLNLVFGEDILWPKNFSDNQGFSTQEVNKIYNAIDCFVTTTTAEGWGLTVTEAMATETPVISPIHTALYEVTGKGKLIEPLKTSRPMIFVNDFEKIREVVSHDEVTRAMATAYTQINNPLREDGQKLIERTEKALQFVKKLTWRKLAKGIKKEMDHLKFNQ